MNRLLNKQDFVKRLFISDKFESEPLLLKCIHEAQLFDVKKWLGDSLLNELSTQFDANTLTTLNNTLLDGGSYTYDENTYFFSGLKDCIAYFTWARFIKTDAFKFTATGIVKKNDTLSEPASNKDLQMLSGDALSSADALKLDVIDYLNRNKVSYPLWNCRSKRRIPTFKIVGE